MKTILQKMVIGLSFLGLIGLAGCETGGTGGTTGTMDTDTTDTTAGQAGTMDPAAEGAREPASVVTQEQCQQLQESGDMQANLELYNQCREQGFIQ